MTVLCAYNVVVSNIARAAVSQQQTTPSIAQFGALYAGNGTYAASTTKLTDLTTSDGTAAGYASGSSITLGSTQGGQTNSASFQVTDTADDAAIAACANATAAAVACHSLARGTGRVSLALALPGGHDARNRADTF